MKKPMYAWLLTIAMAVTLLPGVALGAGGDPFTLTQDITGLSALEVSPGTLTPAFAPQTSEYTVQVEGSVASIRVKPTAAAGASVAAVTAGNQAPAPDGNGWYTIDLNPGQNVILIPVEGGVQYAILVFRGQGPAGPGATDSGGVTQVEPPVEEVPAVFDIAVEVVEKGNLMVSHQSAREGETVTVTPNPDGGYRAKRVTATDSEGNDLAVIRNSNGTWTFAMPAGQVVVGATFRVAEPFTDVKAAAYYHEPVMWALDNDITSGTTPTTFSPEEGCTRAQIITLIWKAKGSPEPAGATLLFTDVRGGDYYYKAVLWAVEQGITSGTTDTTFSPGDVCTRAQAVTLLWNAEGQPQATTPAGYEDVEEAAYYAGAVDWAVEKGITMGVSATAFGPRDTCARAQIITFLYRAFAR